MSLPKNVAASVRARLLSRAKEQGMDYNLILTKYAPERLLRPVVSGPPLRL